MVFAIVCCGNNLGSSVQASVYSLIGLVSAALFANVASAIVGTSRVGSGLALFVVSYLYSIVTGAQFNLVQKFGLAFASIFIIINATSQATDPSDWRTYLWVWGVVPWALLGFACAIFAKLLPIPSPHTAKQSADKALVASSKCITALFKNRMELFATSPGDFRFGMLEIRGAQMAEDTRTQLASLEAALKQAEWEPGMPGMGSRWGKLGFERRRKHAKLLRQVMTELANPYGDTGREDRGTSREESTSTYRRKHKHTSHTLKNAMHPGLRVVAKEFEVLLSALTQTATSWRRSAIDDSDAWFSVVLNNQIDSLAAAMEQLDKAYTSGRFAAIYEAEGTLVPYNPVLHHHDQHRNHDQHNYSRRRPPPLTTFSAS